MVFIAMLHVDRCKELPLTEVSCWIANSVHVAKSERLPRGEHRVDESQSMLSDQKCVLAVIF
jgi:hypothetical protein